MNAYWIYMLKVSMCLVVFYAFYLLLLRNSTFFLFNRLFLLLGLSLSFIIPILKFSIFTVHSNTILSSIVSSSLIESDYDYFQLQNVSNGEISIDYSMILSIIYLFGTSFLFFKLLFSIVSTIRAKNSSKTYQIGRISVVEMDSIIPYSFFNMIFLPKNESNRMIINHEMAHIEQFHWIDLVCIEIASVLLWFNPFVALYKSSLKLQHEYLADFSVVEDCNQVENYLGCMLRQIKVASSSGLVSHFYCKTIKKRITMITKNKSSVKYMWVYSLTIPLICLLLFAFTSKYQAAIINNVEAGIADNENLPSIYPVDETKINKTSGYGERMNPISKKLDFHYGIDLASSKGEKVMVTAKGIVVEAKFDLEQKKGNFIIVKHSDEYSTFYSHLSTISVKVGDEVKKGQTIGEVGSTGVSTGPHLHYEVIKNVERINPKDYLPK